MKTPEPSLAQVLAELKELRKELKAPAKTMFTVDEAAHYLGLSPRTVRNGLGPKAVKPFPVKPVRVAGRVVFRLSDLDAYVAGLGESC
jgi:hypothetical protein